MLIELGAYSIQHFRRSKMTYNPLSQLYRTFPAIIDPDNTDNSLATQIPKTVLFDILERLKALEANPGAGTGGDAVWGSITGNLQNQTDLTNKLATKADATTVTTELTNKADKSTVTIELAKKADTATVITDLATKADASTVTTELAKKADKTTVNEALAKKADTITVNSALTAKADSMMVTTELAKKADKTTVDTALAKKADTTTVTTELAKKADTVTVDAALATKADTTTVDAALDTKADTVTVDAALDTISNRVKTLEDNPTTGPGEVAVWGSITGDLQNQTDLTSKLDTKADAAFIAIELSNKADTTSVDMALATKVDKTTVDAALATKADTVIVDDALASKANTITVNDALATKADTATVNAELAKKADAATVTVELDKKADKTTVDATLDTKAPIIDYDDKTLAVVNQGDDKNQLLTLRNKFYRSVLSTTQFIDGTSGALNVLPYNKGIGIHTVTENGDDSAPYRLDSFEFSLQSSIHTENSNVVNYMIPLQDLIDGVKLTDTSTGAPKFWYSGGYLSKSGWPQKTQVSLSIASPRTLSLFLRSNESTPADHIITVSFILYIATPL